MAERYGERVRLDDDKIRYIVKARERGVKAKDVSYISMYLREASIKSTHTKKSYLSSRGLRLLERHITGRWSRRKDR